jgi:hypothetical protein
MLLCSQFNTRNDKSDVGADIDTEDRNAAVLLKLGRRRLPLLAARECNTRDRAESASLDSSTERRDLQGSSERVTS